MILNWNPVHKEIRQFRIHNEAKTFVRQNAIKNYFLIFKRLNDVLSKADPNTYETLRLGNHRLFHMFCYCKMRSQIVTPQMFYPLDSQNTKKLKKQKLKCRIFTNNSLILVNCLRKSQNINIFSLWKNPKITILFCVLVFSFTYLVLFIQWIRQ